MSDTTKTDFLAKLDSLIDQIKDQITDEFLSELEPVETARTRKLSRLGQAMVRLDELSTNLTQTSSEVSQYLGTCGTITRCNGCKKIICFEFRVSEEVWRSPIAFDEPHAPYAVTGVGHDAVIIACKDCAPSPAARK